MAFSQMPGFNQATNSADEEIESPFNPHAPLPPLNMIEQALVEKNLVRSEGNQSIASKLPGIYQSALSKRLKKLRCRNEGNI